MPKWMKRMAVRDLGEQEQLKLAEAVSSAAGHPVRHELFNGVATQHGLGWGWGLLWACVGAQYGDYRERDKVENYASEILGKLEKMEW
ncbi:hypothetical protein LTR17_023015 [Elasticomyces elasticus]|nr:hypothetical protein LTR17_023015 [Elasticomyces elasticus]